MSRRCFRPLCKATPGKARLQDQFAKSRPLKFRSDYGSDHQWKDGCCQLLCLLGLRTLGSRTVSLRHCRARVLHQIFSLIVPDFLQQSSLVKLPGLTVGMSSLAAGLAIGIVGDAGVRANAQQPRLFVPLQSLSGKGAH